MLRPWRSFAPLQELQALITYIQMNKDSDTDWFTIQPEDGGKAWKGKCWCVAHGQASSSAAAVAAHCCNGQSTATLLHAHTFSYTCSSNSCAATHSVAHS